MFPFVYRGDVLVRLSFECSVGLKVLLDNLVRGQGLNLGWEFGTSIFDFNFSLWKFLQFIKSAAAVIVQ